MKLLSLLLMSLMVVSCFKAKKDENEKVLNLRVQAKIKGMDPIHTDDRYSGNEVARVYEGLLRFHYLKRPFTLEPNLAEAMPTVSDDGLTYTFKIKKGVEFQDDKAFPNGKGRELEAKDFVYSLKRLADAKENSPGWWLLQNKIAGLDEWRKKYSSADKVNYDEEVEGLKAIDKYTLQFKLKKAFPQFLYALAMGFTFAVPREVVEHYGKEFLNHPVGTGPWMLPRFKRGSKIVYKKSPKFRDDFYPSEGAPGDKEAGLLDDAGKKLPLADKLVVHIVEESQPAWLNLMKGNFDVMELPKDNYSTAIDENDNFKPELSSKGFKLEQKPDLDVTFMAFNFKNDLFKNNKKLRQAISAGYKHEEALKLFYNNVGYLAQGPTPPGIAGNDPNYKNPYATYNPELAKKLLAEAGYPAGKGLPEITYETTSTTTSRQMADFFKKNMADIGVKVKVVTNSWPELSKKVKTASHMMYGMAWGADYPDAENFLQLMYGPNKAPGANGSNYDNPEFNEIFKKASKMQDSPERTALYEKLNKMVAEEVPWVYGIHRKANRVKNGWLKNYKYTGFEYGVGRYYNIDLNKKKELKAKL